MSRLGRSRELRDVLFELYSRGVSEQDSYAQLKNFLRFAPLNIQKINIYYRTFRTENEKRLIIEENDSIIKRSEQLSYYSSNMDCDHTKHPCLNEWNGYTSDGRFFLLFKDPINNEDYKFTLLDIFNNKSMEIMTTISAPSEQSSHRFYPLEHNVGLSLELPYGENEPTNISFNLLELDWRNMKIRKLQTQLFNFNKLDAIYVDLFVDSLDPMKFVLKGYFHDASHLFQFGKIENGKITFINEIPMANVDGFDIFCDSLFNNKLYGFNSMPRQYSIDVIDLNKNAQTSKYMLEPIPIDFRNSFCRYKNSCYKFVMERLYASFECRKTKMHKIMWTTCETRKWTPIEFCTLSPIMELNFIFSERLLFIQTLDNKTRIGKKSDIHQVKRTFYRIPLKTPEKLENLVWFSLLRLKNNLQNVDPYVEARKYLPPNSHIQCPF